MVPYMLERSKRVRRMYLQFDSPEYVTLKLPMRYSERSGHRFIHENADWICQTLDARPRVKNLKHFLVKYPRLAIGGFWHKVELRFQRGAFGYVRDPKTRKVTIVLNRALPPEDQLKDILKKIARECLSERVRLFEARVGVKAHGVTVRDQKGRWGSCSETGGISLNWRLILVAPKLQDHVLLHELAHIRHFDHSRSFHALLSVLDPRATEHSNRLHEEAKKVFSLGR